MKSSPLQLKWVAYPALSFSAIITGEPGAPSSIKLSAEVRYELDGEHMASVTINSTDDPKRNFDFSIDAIATFQVDADVARASYSGPPEQYAGAIAVNVIRLLYSSAREMLAVCSARSPIGPIFIETTLIEPKDVSIRSSVKPQEILEKIFKAVAAPASPSVPEVKRESPATAKRKPRSR